MNQFAVLKATRPHRDLLIGALVCAAAMMCVTACAPTSTAQPAGVKRSNNVTPPVITLTPATLTLQSGASTTLTARVIGGEAMLFAVDWKIVEGTAGGTITTDNKRGDDGSYTATYTAPSSSGMFHVVATIREYPASTASLSIQVIK